MNALRRVSTSSSKRHCHKGAVFGIRELESESLFPVLFINSVNIHGRKTLGF
jgi:hypothetical protein